MIPGVRLVVLGKQGAGKGTQCVRLSHHYVVPHVSTGDMLRGEVKSRTTLGVRAESLMDQGELIPDEMVMEMVRARLSERDTRGRGFVLDGCPRTIAQAKHLDEIVHPFGLDIVVDLQVPTALVLKRLASRRVCVDCGANYSTAAPPLVNWTCDVCGGEVVQREDDTLEAIQRRLDLYEAETAPLIAWYTERSLLVSINGTGSRRRGDPPGGRCHRHPPPQAEAGGMRRNDDELAKMRKAGKVVAEMHEKTRAAARPGVTTAELDAVARDVLERRGATSNFLGYHGFPAVICTSPNSMIVHGIPGGYRLEEGDLLSIDCGAIVEGYHGDAAFTMGIGRITPEAAKLIEVTERSLWAGIEQLKKGNALHEVGRAVQKVAEASGFSVVREYVGHAIGTAMHEQPQVPNYWPGTRGPTLKTGMVFAIEPMVNAGSPETKLLEDGWSVVTADGGLSAHFEHTIAVTPEGPEVFTLA